MSCYLFLYDLTVCTNDIVTIIYLFIYLFLIYFFASDTHNLDHMHPYQLLVAVVKKKENSVSG